jgi:S-adenosyl-L-methionine hydrolase (adenosine-forming)
VTAYKHITFLTDFGVQDDYAGVCRGVMKQIAPDSQIINITHGIGPMAVTEGALMLARAIPFMPVCVHLAVIDPGVGGSRRAVAIKSREGRIFVGPDNGLLTLAAGVEEIDAARHLTNQRYHLEHVSRTFHARDVFAPVAAHLAAGVEFDDLGDEIDPATLVCIDLPEPSVSSGGIRAQVLIVDRFGNLQLNLTREHMAQFGAEPGDRVELRFELDPFYAVVAETYEQASRGELMVYEDSYGAFAIAISGGNASELTGAGPGDVVRIGRAYD